MKKLLFSIVIATNFLVPHCFSYFPLTTNQLLEENEKSSKNSEIAQQTNSLLRPVTVRDVKNLVKLFTNEQVGKYAFLKEYSAQELNSRLNKAGLILEHLAQLHEPTVKRFIVQDPSTKSFIGCITLQTPVAHCERFLEERKIKTPYLEISVAIMPHYQHQKYLSKILDECKHQIATQKPSVEGLIFACNANNTRAQEVAEKFGFTNVAQEQITDFNEENSKTDIKIYSCLLNNLLKSNVLKANL